MPEFLQNRLHAGAVLGRDHQHLQPLVDHEPVGTAMQAAAGIGGPLLSIRHGLQNIHQIAAATAGIHVFDRL